jgi:hypothetical protein
MKARRDVAVAKILFATVRKAARACEVVSAVRSGDVMSLVWWRERHGVTAAAALNGERGGAAAGAPASTAAPTAAALAPAGAGAGASAQRGPAGGECSFMYRYTLRESC